MHERRYTGTVVMSTLYQCQDSVLTAVAKRKSISKPHAFYSTWLSKVTSCAGARQMLEAVQEELLQYFATNGSVSSGHPKQ